MTPPCPSAPEQQPDPSSGRACSDRPRIQVMSSNESSSPCVVDRAGHDQVGNACPESGCLADVRTHVGRPCTILLHPNQGSLRQQPVLIISGRLSVRACPMDARFVDVLAQFDGRPPLAAPAPARATAMPPGTHSVEHWSREFVEHHRPRSLASLQQSSVACRPRGSSYHARQPAPAAIICVARADRSQPFDAVLLVSFGGPGRTPTKSARSCATSSAHGAFPTIVSRQCGAALRTVRRCLPASPSITMPSGRRPAGAAGCRRPSADQPVWIGMRNWHPFLDETHWPRWRDAGVRRALALTLAAHHSYSSCGQYKQERLRRARQALQDATDMPRHRAERTLPAGGTTHPGFVAGQRPPDRVRPIGALSPTAAGIAARRA